MIKHSWAATGAIASAVLSFATLAPATASLDHKDLELTFTFQYAEGSGCGEYEATLFQDRAHFHAPDLRAFVSTDQFQTSLECTAHYTVLNQSNRTVGAAVESKAKYDKDEARDRLVFTGDYKIDGRTEGTLNQPLPNLLGKDHLISFERNLRVQPGEHELTFKLGVSGRRIDTKASGTSQVYVLDTTIRRTDT